MKQKFNNLLIALALLAAAHDVTAQGTAFTYQGQLQNNGSPASGTYNLTFSLFSTNTGGNAIAGPLTNNAVVVTNGLFTVLIDFGPGVFNGATNWLQVGVETNGANSSTTLAPRQELTPTAYAIYALNAGSALSSYSVAATNISGTISIGQLSAAVITNASSPSRVGDF
jgi:hypothetical protein